MLTTIVVLVAIVAMAGVWVWAQRAIAERDLAVVERAKAEARALELQRRLDEAQQARVVAESKAQHLESSREQIESTFVALAQRAFQQVGESLVTTSKTQINGSLDTKKAEIDALLKPLREMIESYRGELTKSEHVRNEVYGGLQEQIRALMTANEASYREASRLANALQSPTVRGSWGESSLRRCIELAGMSEFCDFTVQETFFDDEGRRRRPDVVVQLPNTRMIAIDAKVPLEDYTHAANETDDLRRREFLAAHAKTVRRHIDSLSKREYQAAISDTLDFVVLFVPGEHFLSAALVTDPTIFDYAADKKIYLASPTVLLPLLRAINAGWKAERTEENAKKMHDAGVELFNRFVKVMEHIQNVGRALASTVEKYNGAIGSIDRMLWPKGEEMQRMAGSGKDLGDLKQLEVIPLESTKLRLTMQASEPGEVVPLRSAE
ncbi:MAG TPA: DNA recombination protein RmuC [Thermoanaerobaculia bacterium]|jgi:DNA recombination protein RmuC